VTAETAENYGCDGVTDRIACDLNLPMFSVAGFDLPPDWALENWAACALFESDFVRADKIELSV